MAVETTDIGKIRFIITVFCAAEQAAAIEAAVTDKILGSVAEQAASDAVAVD